MADIANTLLKSVEGHRNPVSRQKHSPNHSTRAAKRAMGEHATSTFQRHRTRRPSPLKTAETIQPENSSTLVINSPSIPQPQVCPGPLEPVDVALTDYQRPRPVEFLCQSETNQGLSLSAPADYFNDSSDSSSTSDHARARFPGSTKRVHTRFTCDMETVDRNLLNDLLQRELEFHPNNDFLYFVNPVVDEKVDASMRNDAIHNLRFVHNVFFSLTTHTFCKAINIIDRFIAKVKVKPKYMACVATAAYRAASSLTSDVNGLLELPETKTMVQITRCGGNEQDLQRMEDILVSKLGPSLENVNAYDFLLLFMQAVVGRMPLNCGDAEEDDEDCAVTPVGCSDDGDSSNTTATSVSKLSTDSGFDDYACQDLLSDIYSCSPDSPIDLAVKQSLTSMFDYVPLTPVEKARSRLMKQLRTRMEMSLCSLEVYRYRPACLALAIMAYTGISGLDPLLKMANLSWDVVNSCADLVEYLCDYEGREVPRFKSNRLAYNSCRRRFLRLGYSSPTPLDTISEDYEPIEDAKAECMTLELSEE